MSFFLVFRPVGGLVPTTPPNLYFLNVIKKMKELSYSLPNLPTLTIRTKFMHLNINLVTWINLRGPRLLWGWITRCCTTCRRTRRRVTAAPAEKWARGPQIPGT
jgi:hypothetical protein